MGIEIAVMGGNYKKPKASRLKLLPIRPLSKEDNALAL